jgi:DNA-binding SARP family transcriptional activator
MPRIDVRVLGPPHILVDGVAKPVSGRQLLLALRLAVADRRPVAAKRLLSDVWPGDAGSEGAFRVALTRLRAHLGEGAIERHANGYALTAQATVDAIRFADLTRSACDRARTVEQRIATYEEALGLWRGPAFDGMERVAWLDAEAVRLEEQREQATDERFELCLLTNRSATVISELRAALDRQPTREHRAELLATALYRAGRQADALEVLASTREVLRENLGLDPGPSLRALELRILRHDDELRAPPLELRDQSRANVESQLRSANRLARVGALDEALAIIDEAASSAASVGDRASYAYALLARAQAGSLAGSIDPHPLIDEARSIGRELRDGPLLARCAMIRFGSGVPFEKQSALVEIIEPLELLPASAGEQLDLLCVAAVVVTFIDSSEAADRLVAAADRVHELAPTPRSEAVVLTTRCIVGSVRGVPVDQLVALADRAYAVASGSGDDTLIVVSLHAVLRAGYLAGDLRRVDSVLDELGRASAAALLPFGTVRVSLCQTTNALARGELDAVPGLLEKTRSEGARLSTFSAQGAALGQEALLMFETDRTDELLARMLALTETQPPGAFNAMVELCTQGDGSKLLEIAPDVVQDDLYPSFVGLSAVVAARARNRELGAYCAPILDGLGSATLASGFGSVVVGYASHFAGLAHVALGDLTAAVSRLESACELAEASGALLWLDWSRIELAAALLERGEDGDAARAAMLWNAVGAAPPIRASARLARRHEEVGRQGAADDSRA